MAAGRNFGSATAIAGKALWIRSAGVSDTVSGSFAKVADGKAVRGIVVEAGVLAYAGACNGYAAPLRSRLGTPPGPGPDMPSAVETAIAGSKPWYSAVAVQLRQAGSRLATSGGMEILGSYGRPGLYDGL